MAKGVELANATVVLIRVDIAQFRKLPVDASSRDPNAPPPPPEMSELVPELNAQPGDLRITEPFWGAFLGTDLEA